jgi:hypothetical protein
VLFNPAQCSISADETSKAKLPLETIEAQFSRKEINEVWDQAVIVWTPNDQMLHAAAPTPPKCLLGDILSD